MYCPLNELTDYVIKGDLYIRVDVDLSTMKERKAKEVHIFRCQGRKILADKSDEAEIKEVNDEIEDKSETEKKEKEPLPEKDTPIFISNKIDEESEPVNVWYFSRVY